MKYTKTDWVKLDKYITEEVSKCQSMYVINHNRSNKDKIYDCSRCTTLLQKQNKLLLEAVINMKDYIKNLNE